MGNLSIPNEEHKTMEKMAKFQADCVENESCKVEMENLKKIT